MVVRDPMAIRGVQVANPWGKSFGAAFGTAVGAAVIAVSQVASGNSGGGGFRDPSLTSLFSLASVNEYDSEADLQLQIQQEDEALFMVIAQLTVNGAFA